MDIKNKFDRQRLLRILEDNIETMNDRVDNRVRNPKNERIKIDRMKAIVYACKTYSDILKEQEIEEVNERLKRLEEDITILQNQEDDKETLISIENAINEIDKINSETLND